MTRYGMVIDIGKCSGCYNCFLACKDEHCGHEYPGYTAAQPDTSHSWLRLIERERGKYPKIKLAYIPVLCMHCQSATCLKASENGAVYRRSDGIIIIDPEKAKGQKQLVSSCPYRVIYWNEEKNLPQKCTFCAHLLDEGWKSPRCVELCPTGALTFGDLEDSGSEVTRLVASNKTESFQPEYNLKENVVYVGIPRKFIAGTVVSGDRDECVKGADVMLSRQDGQRWATKTNGFGDFEFDGLEGETEYNLRLTYPGYSSVELNVRTKIDVYLGEITLAPISEK